ncbi:MAG: hypothetical protein KC983_06925 [Phycisphaerales bacterium]|nr:hypothetical protein [Phycisphaerales bacterium]
MMQVIFSPPLAEVNIGAAQRHVLTTFAQRLQQVTCDAPWNVEFHVQTGSIRKLMPYGPGDAECSVPRDGGTTFIIETTLAFDHEPQFLRQHLADTLEHAAMLIRLSASTAGVPHIGATCGEAFEAIADSMRDDDDDD